MTTAHKINITKHALKRMVQRNIGLPTLNAVLADGDFVGGPDPYKLRLELCGFRAVVMQSLDNPGVVNVLTVYERGETRRGR